MPSDRPTSRRSRRLLFAAAIAFFAAMALLASPRFQSWLVRRVLAGTHEPWQLGFERLGVGPTGLNATGLNFSMPGVSATSAPLIIRVAPTRLFSQRELSIERIEAQKIRVVLTPEDFASTSSKPFEGLLQFLQIPLRWQLDAAHLDGEIVVREGGASRAVGHFSLRGGGLGPASVGNFVYELTANSMILAPGPNHEFSSRGNIRLTQTTTHGIGRVELDGDLRLPAYGQFTLPAGSIHIVLEAAPHRETYHTRVSFKDAATLDFAADLDATHHQGIAKLTVHANQDLLAPLLQHHLPRAAVDGSADISFDLARGDWKLSLQEKLDASELDHASGALAGMKGDSFNGNVSLIAEKRGEQTEVHVFDAALRDQSDALLHLTLPRDLDLSSWLHPAPIHSSEDLTLHAEILHAPLRWLGVSPPAALALEAGECDGAWNVTLDHDLRIHVSPTVATKLSHLRPQPIGFAKLPELQLAFWPNLTLMRSGFSANARDIELTSQQGDRVHGSISVAQIAAAREIVSEGSVEATLPSLLQNAHGALPLSLHPIWNLSLADGSLRIDRFSLSAQETIPAQQNKETDRINHDTPPLGSVSASPLQKHWPVIVESERPFSVLLATGKLTAAAASPNHPTHVSSQNDKSESLLVVSFDHAPLAWASPKLPGSLSGKLSLLDPAGSISADLNLEASFPFSKGEPAQSIRATLNAHVHPVTPRILAADTFSLTANGSGATATLTAPEPFLFGLSNSGSIACSTLQSLKLHLDGLSLAELKPWMPNLALAGTLAPSDFLLTARQTHYTLEAVGPLHVEHLSNENQRGTPFVRDGEIVFSPHLELDFLCETRPKLEFAYQGRIGASRVTLQETGRPLLSVDGSVGFKGNDRIFLADTIDLDGDLHLDSLPQLNRVPSTGDLTLHAHGDLLGDRPLSVNATLSNVLLDRRTLPRLTFALEGNVSSDLVLTGRARVELATIPDVSDVTFEAKLNLIDGKLNIASGLHSQFLDLVAFEDVSRSFAPTPTTANASTLKKSAKAPERNGRSNTPENTEGTASPFWGDLRGSFALDLARVDFSPYRIDSLVGRVQADDRTLRLEALTGQMFAGRWRGDVTISHDPEATNGDHQLNANFDILQFESARVVQTVFPNQLASVDAKIDVHTRIQSHGSSFHSLLDQSHVDFSVVGASGVLHLTVPKADTLASAAVFGGTILLSPELRALGRLIRKLSEMPMDRLSITGQREAGGEVSIAELIFDSPQLQLHGHGQIAEVAGEPLMNRPLTLSLDLAARDELAVILDGMRLLTNARSPEGFRPLRQSITIGGRTGSPDTTHLYDLFAQAVSGSHGTWGVLMRHLQTQMKKH